MDTGWEEEKHFVDPCLVCASLGLLLLTCPANSLGECMHAVVIVFFMSVLTYSSMELVNSQYATVTLLLVLSYTGTASR